MPLEREQIGACTLYRGDCYEVLDDLPRVALCTDPPYGMAYNVDSRRFTGGDHPWTMRTLYKGCKPIRGDKEDLNLSFVQDAPEAIVWGFNHFARTLGNGGCLIWLKRYDTGFGRFLSDAEVAWMKGRQGVYCRRDLSAKDSSTPRLHPAQKPVSVLAWCLTFIKGTAVLDPFMGVGTTGLACLQQGKRFIGVELDREYFDLACQRITAAYAQPDLFVPTPPPPRQQPLFVTEGMPHADRPA